MRDRAATAPLELADLVRIAPLAEAEVVHLATRRVAQVVLAETFERLQATAAGSLVVLHAEAATGGWSLATALHVAWERSACAVVVPRAAMSDSSAVLAERLDISLFVIDSDPVDLALALAAQVSAPRAARALRIALCAERLAEQSSIRGVLGVLNDELAPSPVALEMASSVLAGRAAAVEERAGHRRVAVEVKGFTGRAWATLVASVPESTHDVAGQVESVLRLARLPLLAAWSQSRMSTAERTSREQAAFELLRSSVTAPADPHRTASSPATGAASGAAVTPARPDVDVPAWSSELGWRVEGHNRAVWIAPLAGRGQEPSPELTQLVRAAWQRHRQDWPVVPQVDGWVSWRNTPKTEDAAAMRRSLAGLASVTATHGLVLGVGGQHPGAAGLLRSVTESRLAAHAAHREGPGSVVWFEQVGARAALAWLPVARIAEVADLALPDLVAARDRGTLVATALAVLDCGGSLSGASAGLGVHRNTVLARMARARELGLDLDDPSRRLALHLLCYALAAAGRGSGPGGPPVRTCGMLVHDRFLGEEALVGDYYTEQVHGRHERFDLGTFDLASGYSLPGATLAYQTAGTLNEAKDNAVLLPHMYSGTAAFMHAFIGEDRPLDPRRSFFILPAQLGDGFSSSPSNTAPPFDRGAFPAVAISDDVRAQHRLVTEHFGIERLAMVSGWSMGGQQTLEWAVRFPDAVARAVPFAATLRNPEHCRVFCDLHMQALRSDPEFHDGFYASSDDVHVGLRRHAQAFALMGATWAMYREEAWRELGFASRDGFVQGFLQAYFLPMDPNNLLTQAHKWTTSDVAADHGGDLDAAVGRVSAQVTDVAFTGDLFFPPEDVRADAERIPGATYREIGSVWGHFTMFNLRAQDTAEIDAVYADVLG